jgi:hypothetical protein
MSDECTCNQCRPELWTADGVRRKTSFGSFDLRELPKINVSEAHNFEPHSAAGDIIDIWGQPHLVVEPKPPLPTVTMSELKARFPLLQLKAGTKVYLEEGLHELIEDPVYIRAFGEPARPITNPALAERIRADAIARENPTPVSAVIAHGTYEPTGWAKGDELEAQAHAQAFDEGTLGAFDARDAFNTSFEPGRDGFDPNAGVLSFGPYVVTDGGFFYRDEPQQDVNPDWFAYAQAHGLVAQQDLPRSIDAILADLEENAEELEELRNERSALLEELCDTIDDEVA